MMDLAYISSRLEERSHGDWLDFLEHCVEIAGYQRCMNSLAFETPDGAKRIDLYELDRWMMQAPAQMVIQQIAAV